MDYIKIDNKQRPVCFGWNALAEFEELTGKDLVEFAGIKNLSAGNTIKLIYVGLSHGAKKENESVNFTIENVGDWMTEDVSIIMNVVEIFAKSMPDVGKKK